ncbi:hypothetical protein [Mycolicibacterium elephantis]|uniref:Uncharacterized protein n=1 Tax=Mycolicibacterium elephantis DSM 44368 TaxID=1335622 RepID=A0A439E0Z3_9MYCO|nr:hypothetical protein [Mycolicibacterium elephantis]MCV7221602.1 hypothetical protein [Mycolicibacterium elephantis]RWA24041.1 hypothetical protein MELE44368_02180 [Mycolicibacterium elephantis DSM 44368]
MQQPSTVNCRYCTVPTRSPDRVCDFCVDYRPPGDEGRRVVFAPDQCAADAVAVRASCTVTAAGAILDTDGEHPGVHVSLPERRPLTFDEARAAALALLDAANQVEQWAREAAKQRHPANVGRADERGTR